ncbi:MAG: MBL fold metallo-hydrolase [Candidatus Freyarchaeota archaeon]|nr:MBL fold metallo-hydrolase [Candidatus Jordarchaeia archaeon]MBS7269260.1 MBL fold metallo-hydrolase [Candidatus Jordarchaeia archaeon]MBS7280128.1 MBL fold metallo-hydrolase [Candidatus Jordarchaeia archaeon]
MEIQFLGGCQSVGGSGIFISVDGCGILADYGIYMNRRNQAKLPLEPPEEVDAAFMTHAHLDHSGAFPYLYTSDNFPLYLTRPTYDFVDILYDDMFKLERLPFGKEAKIKALKNCVFVNYNQKISLNHDCKVTFLNAGHIPGSYSLLIEAEGKRLLYTSDFNTIKTQLLEGAKFEQLKVDALILESTYALETHPDRANTEKQFIKTVNEILRNGGTVLVPAFAVARSQEILCLLKSNNVEYPITLDGLARSASIVISRHPEFVRDYELLLKSLSSCRWVKNDADRIKAVSASGIIVTTAGMMKGGPVSHYMNILAEEPDSAVLLVSFQIPGTPGRTLLDTGQYPTEGGMSKVNAQIKFFNFSSHSDRPQLIQTIESIKRNSETTVFLVHGEKKVCTTFKEDVEKEFGLETFCPTNGETFII